MVAPKSIDHTFYDIEIEAIADFPDLYLVKILSIDGRRFTYQFRGELDEDAVNYIKSVIDAACFSDMVIERQGPDFNIIESRQRLKKHS